MIFEIFRGYLYNRFGIVLRKKSILKNLVSKIDFSLAFYAEKLKNVKIHFLVTKSGQNWNLITFSDPRPKTCIYFISTFPWICALHTSSRGGCGSRNFGKDFPPLQHEIRTFRRICLGMKRLRSLQTQLLLRRNVKIKKEIKVVSRD